MRIDISTEAADLITRLALDEMHAVESGLANYGSRDDNIGAIEALAEVIGQIEANHPNTLRVTP